MAVTRIVSALATLALLAGATAAQAQAPAPAPLQPPTETRLVFDREVFSYPGGGRRDPFKPLIGKESLGPLFDDLTLRGIIYSADPARSIVLLQDGAKRQYRLKRGDVVGNSRVVEIRQVFARFAVENFGMIRYEVLELREGAAEAAGIRSGTPVPATAPISGTGPQTSSTSAKRMLDSIAKERRDAATKEQE